MAFIPHTEADVEAMLAAIGAERLEDLFDEIPPALRVQSLAGVPEALEPGGPARCVQPKSVYEDGGSASGHGISSRDSSTQPTPP